MQLELELKVGNLKLHLHLHLSLMSGFVRPRVGALYINLFWKVFQPLQPAYRPKAVAQPSGLCFPEPSASGGDEASIEDGTVKSIRVFRNKRASAALSWDGLLNT